MKALLIFAFLCLTALLITALLLVLMSTRAELHEMHKLTTHFIPEVFAKTARSGLVPPPPPYVVPDVILHESNGN